MQPLRQALLQGIPPGAPPRCVPPQDGGLRGSFLCLCLAVQLRLSRAMHTRGVSAFPRHFQGRAGSPAAPRVWARGSRRALRNSCPLCSLWTHWPPGSTVGLQSLQAQPSSYVLLDTPCGLNGFPRLQLQRSHHFLLAAGAGNPLLPSSLPPHRYRIFLMHFSPASSRHLPLKKPSQMFVGWQLLRCLAPVPWANGSTNF